MRAPNVLEAWIRRTICMIRYTPATARVAMAKPSAVALVRDEQPEDVADDGARSCPEGAARPMRMKTEAMGRRHCVHADQADQSRTMSTP